MHGSKPFLALELDGRPPVERILELVLRLRPARVTLAAGEPLVFDDELGILMPSLDRLGIEVVVVTRSRTRIPAWYGMWDNLHVVVRREAAACRGECVFAQLTRAFAADLVSEIDPCLLCPECARIGPLPAREIAHS